MINCMPVKQKDENDEYKPSDDESDDDEFKSLQKRLKVTTLKKKIIKEELELHKLEKKLYTSNPWKSKNNVKTRNFKKRDKANEKIKIKMTIKKEDKQEEKIYNPVTNKNIINNTNNIRSIKKQIEIFNSKFNEDFISDMFSNFNMN
jgi:hypothetical protein